MNGTCTVLLLEPSPSWMPRQEIHVGLWGSLPFICSYLEDGLHVSDTDTISPFWDRFQPYYLLWAEPCPPKIHMLEVLTPGISEYDLIWRQDLYR